MKLLLVNLSMLNFDVLTPEREPLGGSESCVCYLARQMAKQGHEVSLMARLPPDTPTVVAGVRHFPVLLARDQAFFAAEQFDAIILCNTPVAAPFLRELNPNALLVFWNHLAPDHELVLQLNNPLIRQSLGCMVYVSEWQKAETEKRYGVIVSSSIIGNGLTPSFENMFASATELRQVKQNRAAYTTTPFRGLHLLLPAMDDMEPKMPLDIYSSMRVYQIAEEKDWYADLYQEAKARDYAHYHTPVSQSVLPERLKPVAFLTYPCIYGETFCNVALEAMAAGMKVIATDFSALPSTTMGFADLVPIGDNKADAFIAAFRQAIVRNVGEFQSDPVLWAEKMFDQVQAVNRACTWARRAEAWEGILGSERRGDRS